MNGTDAAAPPSERNVPAGWGLALAVTGFLLLWIPFGVAGGVSLAGARAAVAISLLGALLGRIGLGRFRSGRARSRGVALSAVVVGLAGPVLLALVLLVYLAITA